MQTWAAAFRRAQLSQGHRALRSLAAVAAGRASKIEESVARARMAHHRAALAAPGGPAPPRSAPRAPGRLAFRYVRGLGG
eukprot:3482535-Pyramimonas_sp.AAC.1